MCYRLTAFSSVWSTALFVLIGYSTCPYLTSMMYIQNITALSEIVARAIFHNFYGSRRLLDRVNVLKSTSCTLLFVLIPPEDSDDVSDKIWAVNHGDSALVQFVCNLLRKLTIPRKHTRYKQLELCKSNFKYD
jgi:hypothetical protein